MTTIAPLPPVLDIRGKINFCPAQPVRPCGLYVVQRVAPGLGNIDDRPARDLQLRVHVVPFDPRTAPQLARRAIFAAGVAAWHAYDQSERDAWNTQAASRHLTGFALHMSVYLRSH